MKWFSRNMAVTLVCIILGLMLSWQYISVKSNNDKALYENVRLEDLKDQLLNEKNTSQKLRNRIDELQKQIQEIETSKGNVNAENEWYMKELDRVRMIAGLVDVRGKGLIITLDDYETFVEDDDILKVLNELRASDAQAISVNGERIVAMSEVRVAGKYIMINGVQMLPPFEIKAIADPDKLENSLRIIDGVLEKLEAWGLKVSVVRSDDILIRKVRDDGSVLKYDLLTPVK